MCAMCAKGETFHPPRKKLAEPPGKKPRKPPANIR